MARQRLRARRRERPRRREPRCGDRRPGARSVEPRPRPACMTIRLVTDRRRRSPIRAGRRSRRRRRRPYSDSGTRSRRRGARRAGHPGRCVARLDSPTRRTVVNDRRRCRAGLRSPRGPLARRLRAAGGRAIDCPPGFLEGSSVHTREEALAVAAHVDYVIAGTVFPTSSKPGRTELLGLSGLASIATAVRVPVTGDWRDHCRTGRRRFRRPAPRELPPWALRGR